MTNSKKIIIVATLIHLAAIVYGIIRGLWDAVILATVFLVASLLYSFNKKRKS
jgi:predicted neutral ceramidase superfamily lipid hydrolase